MEKVAENGYDTTKFNNYFSEKDSKIILISYRFEFECGQHVIGRCACMRC